MVRKAFSRLVYHDLLKIREQDMIRVQEQRPFIEAVSNLVSESTIKSNLGTEHLKTPEDCDTKRILMNLLQQLPEQWRNPSGPAIASSYSDRALEQGLLGISKEFYDSKAAVAAEVQCQIGNTYTASIWVGLAGLIEALGSKLINRRILLFSYGSGAMAMMLSIVGRIPSHNSSDRGGVGSPTPDQESSSVFSVKSIAEKLHLRQSISDQLVCSPIVFDNASKVIEEAYHSGHQYRPHGNIEALREGSYFLDEIDATGRRVYKRKNVVP